MKYSFCKRGKVRKVPTIKMEFKNKETKKAARLLLIKLTKCDHYNSVTVGVIDNKPKILLLFFDRHTDRRKFEDIILHIKEIAN